MIDRSFWPGRRVLITGCTGFKGSWLSLWLQRLGADVVGCSRGVPATPSLFEAAGVAGDMELLEVDVRDADALRGAIVGRRPEVVIHMAGQSQPRHSLRDPVGTYETNVIGTVNLLEAARRCESVRALVNVTSDKCYEKRDGGRGYRENDPLGGEDPYSSSKACSELVTAAYRRSFYERESTANVATARTGNMIGGGDWARDRLIPDLIRGALEGAPTVIRDPNAVRPWQHVLSALQGYLLLAQRLWDSAEYAEPWNLGPPEVDVRPVRSVADRLVELWGDGMAWTEDPGAAADATGPGRLTLDSSKAHHRLGWRAAWSFEEALDSVVEWYRTARDGGDLRELTLRQIGAFEEVGDRVPTR
jgi:CDP-glucose 4,6-dehydratase